MNQLTIKSQEALQAAQQLAQESGHQFIENLHLLKGMIQIDENVLPFIFKKLNVNLALVIQLIDSSLSALLKVEGGDIQLSRDASKTVNGAISIATKMDDEYVSLEHLLLSLFDGKSTAAHILKDQGITKSQLEKAIEELRQGSRVTSASAEETYNSLK
ncbi:ClpB protein [Nonlabens ulvanivorans]|uniref:ClpB protein n=1 Tax=Nonlabens ulvanivorans TaxID=906888 RepID=A0A090R1L9_NONUL|nr:ClpB protein [Nonlabens ulvanivorans]